MQQYKILFHKILYNFHINFIFHVVIIPFWPITTMALHFVEFLNTTNQNNSYKCHNFFWKLRNWLSKNKISLSSVRIFFNCFLSPMTNAHIIASYLAILTLSKWTWMNMLNFLLGFFISRIDKNNKPLNILLLQQIFHIQIKPLEPIHQHDDSFDIPLQQLPIIFLSKMLICHYFETFRFSTKFSSKVESKTKLTCEHLPPCSSIPL